jgi:fructosamine-3-kinase
MLHAAQETVNKFIEYFNAVDPLERDEQTGKPVYKVKDIMTELSSLGKVHDELIDLESRVKKELAEKSTIRGGAIEGYEPD